MSRDFPILGLCVLVALAVTCIMPLASAYSGPCPIGSGGAPNLINPGLSSGAQCRQACGGNCPEERCDLLTDSTGAATPIVVAIDEPRGFCTYNNVLHCPTHAGCREHDDCFDVCTESRGMYEVTDSCHMTCNKDCVSRYGLTNCVLWADAPTLVYESQFTSSMGYIIDHASGVDYDGYLVFSDEPVFTPKPLTTTITPTPTQTGDDTDDDEADSPLSGILKEKPKIQNSAADWIKEGERARRAKDYQGAIDCFNAAEGIIASGYKDKDSRPASVDEALADVEEYKIGVYANWPGHEAERQEARQNVKDLTQSAEAKKKLEAWNLPGFEVSAALLSVMLLFLFRRIKP
jgi:hypothetical protein